MELYNDDCLKVMKEFESNSIDLLFCDLPYGQTSCKWDSLIDLDEFWKQVNRICKDSTPMFFTCSTKFGVSLINSNPKNFRYDLIWVKSSPCGFLNAKKMPMKKHEMVYVFYKKLPLYDLSSHTHKFIKDKEETYITTTLYSDKKGKPRQVYRAEEGQYDPPLPTSVVREDKGCKSMYGEEKKKVFIYDETGKLRNSETRYDPPLPTSVVRETSNYKNESDMYGKIIRTDCMRKKNESMYDPPLPTSVVKEDTKHKTLYNDYVSLKHPDTGSRWEPPLPNSILEVASQKGKHATQKPVGLMEWCLKYYSKEGDKVLDPTMGSGSTGIACKNMNRHFIGIEMDKEIYDVAVERLNK
jgi:DNA modification methylase